MIHNACWHVNSIFNDRLETNIIFSHFFYLTPFMSDCLHTYTYTYFVNIFHWKITLFIQTKKNNPIGVLVCDRCCLKGAIDQKIFWLWKGRKRRCPAEECVYETSNRTQFFVPGLPCCHGEFNFTSQTHTIVPDGQAAAIAWWDFYSWIEMPQCAKCVRALASQTSES